MLLEVVEDLTQEIDEAVILQVLSGGGGGCGSGGGGEGCD